MLEKNRHRKQKLKEDIFHIFLMTQHISFCILKLPIAKRFGLSDFYSILLMFVGALEARCPGTSRWQWVPASQSPTNQSPIRLWTDPRPRTSTCPGKHHTSGWKKNFDPSQAISKMYLAFGKDSQDWFIYLYLVLTNWKGHWSWLLVTALFWCSLIIRWIISMKVLCSASVGVWQCQC